MGKVGKLIPDLDKAIVVALAICAFALGAFRVLAGFAFFAIAGSAILPWALFALTLTLAYKLARKGF